MLPLALLAKWFLSAVLTEKVKAKILAELRDSAADTTTKVDDALVAGLDLAWDDFWEAVSLGLKR